MFQDYKLPQFNTVLILFLLFIWRMAFGLCSEFWFPDELQIYLLGLKWYTTGAWPYYGPDVVYTQTQIPRALQALLVGAPLHIWPVPESPVILLNILSFMSLTLFGYYLSKRFTQFPSWFIYAWILTALWPMSYGTRAVVLLVTGFAQVALFIGKAIFYPGKTGEKILKTKKRDNSRFLFL